MPGDPADSKPFMVQSPNAACFLMLWPITVDIAMPLDKQVVIDSIHGFLSENQGLIQVEADKDYVYSIVKSLKEEGGAQYILTFQKFFGESVLNIQAYFDEIGTTGIRDTMVYALCRRENVVGDEKNPFADWTCDPYEVSYKKGALMNLSEQEKYDDMFPGFPLSICREVVRTLLS